MAPTPPSDIRRTVAKPPAASLWISFQHANCALTRTQRRNFQRQSLGINVSDSEFDANVDGTFPRGNRVAAARTESISATIEALVKALAKAYNMQIQAIQAALSPAETCV
jgi:hypothetical protein